MCIHVCIYVTEAFANDFWKLGRKVFGFCVQGNRAIAEIQFADYIYPALDQVKVTIFVVQVSIFFI